MDFWGKVVPGLQGCESAHGARANVHGQRCERAWATKPARQCADNSAAMWAKVFLGLAARLKDTCSVRFVLHKSLKNQRIGKYVQVSC